MEQIILKVDPKTVRPNEACQRLVVFDRQTQEVVEPGLFARLTGGLEYFLVTNSNHPEAVVHQKKLPIEIPDFLHDSLMRFSLDYEARCVPGGEALLVHEMGPEPDHQAHLDASIKRWILDFARRRAIEWQEQYSALKSSLYEELKLRALKDFGLALEPRLSLEKRPGRLTIGPRMFTVRVKNTRVLVDVQVEIVLDAEQNRELLAHQRNHLLGELEGAVIEQVELYLAKVSLHQLAYEPQDVQAELAAQLAALAREHGRYVSHIAYTCDPEGKTLQSIRRSLVKEYVDRFTHPEYPKPIEVRISYQLALKELDRYLASKSPKLEEWMEQSAREACMKQLFDATYDDLCENFSEKKGEIEKTLRKSATGIGYGLAQLTTITSHELDKLRDTFTVELPNLELPTRSDRPVMALMDVSAKLHIRDLPKVKKHLVLLKDVPTEVRDAISTKLKEILRDTDPKTFFVDFRVAHNGKPSLEEKLKQTIKEHLEAEFGAVVTELHCQPRETPLTERLGELTRSSQPFLLEIQPSAGGEEVVFMGRLNIVSVHLDGWSRLCELMPDPQSVLESVLGFLKSRLSMMSVEELTLWNNREMEENLSDVVDEHTKKEFGLRVKVINWCRKSTQQERARAEDFKLSQAARAQISDIQRGTAIELAAREQKQKLDEEERLRKQLVKCRDDLEAAREAGEMTRVNELSGSLARLERDHRTIRDEINERVHASSLSGSRRGLVATDKGAGKVADPLGDFSDDTVEAYDR